MLKPEPQSLQIAAELQLTQLLGQKKKTITQHFLQLALSRPLLFLWYQ